MKPTSRRYLVTVLLAFAALASALAPELARGDSDHDDAWRARMGGDILALPDVLGKVSPHIEGEIIETEFEYERGRPVYEFKYVDKGGRVRELYVDARTGTILKDKPD